MQGMSRQKTKPTNHRDSKRRGKAQGISKITNKITPENYPNYEMWCPFGYRRPLRHQTDRTKT
jgi:hypothetical protein